MAGRIQISSAVEDLSSVSAKAVDGSLEDYQEEALLGMWGAVNSNQPQLDASLEALEALNPTSPKACSESAGAETRPPLVSKVIDANGNAYISIIYDGHPYTGGGNCGVITGLLDSASENDVVDITIATALQNFNQPVMNPFSVLSILSSIRTCKAKVITRIGCFTSLADCALWLSGTDRRISPMGWLAVRQPRMSVCGTTTDAEFRVEDVKVQEKTIADFVVASGLLKQEEIDKMYDEQTMIGLSYEDLFNRISALKK